MRTAPLPLACDTTAPAYPSHAEQLPAAIIRRGRYAARFARTAEELDAVLRLRYEVFNLELKEGLTASHLTGRDMDEYDLTCHHLVVIDQLTGATVGTYRLRTGEMAFSAGGFYSAGEFDLSALPAHVLNEAVETGRAAVARAHRHTQVLFLLWKGLAAYMTFNRKRYFFGCCSLPGQDPRTGLRVLNYLEQHDYLHPSLAVRPRPGCECAPEGYFIVDGQELEIPQLFANYLRFGAKVCGPPAIDRSFRTVDFFVLFDATEMTERARRLFFEPRPEAPPA